MLLTFEEIDIDDKCFDSFASHNFKTQKNLDVDTIYRSLPTDLLMFKVFGVEGLPSHSFINGHYVSIW